MLSINSEYPKEPTPWRVWVLLAIIFAILLFIGLNGCVSDRAFKRILAENCPKVSDSTAVKIDSSRTEKDLPSDTSKIRVFVPGPIRWLPHPCANLCDSTGHLKHIDVTDHKNGITSHTYSKNDTLVNECSEDSLLVVNHRKEITINKNREVIRKLVYEVIKPKPITWFDKAKTASFWILAGSFFILLIGGILYFRHVITESINSIHL